MGNRDYDKNKGLAKWKIEKNLKRQKIKRYKTKIKDNGKNVRWEKRRMENLHVGKNREWLINYTNYTQSTYL